MSASRADHETNEHIFDLKRHSVSQKNEYGDTQRSCSSRASLLKECRNVPYLDPEACDQYC
jgi:hypothetical protein